MRGCPLVLFVAANLFSVCAADRKVQAEVRQLGCRVDRSEWRRYRDTYETALETRSSGARRALAIELLDRTSNVSDVLTCNVGVIAGYHLLARLMGPGAEFLQYRLLQLALVFIFTLRNANQIPEEQASAWETSERAIIPWIMHLRRLAEERALRARAARVPVSPQLRDKDLRIGVVSICAYPEDAPLALPRLTPQNREDYALRHDYAARVHMEPPVIGAHGLGIQHAKLATMLVYLESGEFDWVAWFDCDSLLMNMNKTLDSIVYQYAHSPPDDTADLARPCTAVDDVVGLWRDSWADASDAAVEIQRLDDYGAVRASAPQFGVAEGFGRPGKLEMNFPGEATPLSAEVRHSGDVQQLRWENGAVWEREDARNSSGCRPSCSTPEGCPPPEGVDLLITEEGWGLSSANWMIRRSAWSINFLHRALTVAHAEFQLFGDQDAIILLLMNEQALRAVTDGEGGDPLDGHAAIIPQHELNAYDHLNALTMDVDGFAEGDLLVTFPQCSHAEECNPLFELATSYSKAFASGNAGDSAGAWWQRSTAAPRWDGYDPSSGTSLRLFGPRPAVRAAWAGALGTG